MKKGFTLIELLTVIVILAIIALIATPIVINIISDTKESAFLRSAEFYLDGVEFSIASAKLNNRTITNGKYNILENGNICLKYEEDNKTCNDILEVEVNGDKPKSGVITVANGEIEDISLNLGNKDIVKNEKGELVYYESPCKKVSGDKNTPGSLYECEVKPGVKYNFYVLSQELDGTTNLIMDRNIYYDSTTDTSTAADSTNTGLVAWVSKDDYNDDTNYGNLGNNNKGPITAMNYLYKATKDWINIPNMIMDYTDEGSTGDYGYGRIVTENGITQITRKDETAVTVLTDKEGYINLKARLPYKSEVSSYSANSNNKYLYDNLACQDNTSLGGPYICVSGVNHIDGIDGYWTLSSSVNGSYFVWLVNFSGIVVGSNLYDKGVRPVINLKL